MQMSLFSLDFILYLAIVFAILPMMLKADDNRRSLAIKHAAISRGIYVMPDELSRIEQDSCILSYDVLIQLCTVMAIIYINEGNRCRRLSDLRTAKQYYKMAIRFQQYVRQMLIYVHHPLM